MKLTRRVLKYYSRVIAESIPLFVTAGLLSVFSAGIFQNEHLYEMSKILSSLVIPVFMGYKAGTMCGGEVGGLAGTLAASVVVMAEPVSAMILSVTAGGVAGFLCKKGLDRIKNWIPSGFEMLFSNLYLASLGLLAGGAAYVLLIPEAEWMLGFLGNGLSLMIDRGIIPFISFVVEPLKIIFFNNWINHGIFLPLGLEQLKTQGSSILFLLETNPGPGFGILLAYTLANRNIRKPMVSSLIIQFLGGIHEVYFPYILSDIRLLAGAIAGSIAGNYCFMVTGSGLLGPASPGSIITILIMADKKHWLGIVMGISISAAVSCFLSCLILSGRRREPAIDKDKEQKVEEMPVKRMEHAKIYFVCDVGLGSSAMASAIFKKKLRLEGLTGIEVFHVSVDRIPADADAIVCQKNFARSLPEINIPCFTVDNLTDMSGYKELLNWLMGGE
ncbi:protein-N(pi)-phosphohistidine--sugar phosphotransferase [Clostridium boliviensis]|uniref:Protein-N(Pi)-phosphohistidine--sugar phosphotransferase n=1 Tax=Clostridium boliviensis TaxID=318465 RepID=A0ABU4GRE5_9CLOT|nr:protein-N(pi)-phosphohistidine--sugar phosphotransferase [Clostridium boliviensis]MDW2800210.1 protein-N(pi)-phosphohistidine--sugar phosphotransferase [Clostridium boliviensis]